MSTPSEARPDASGSLLREVTRLYVRAQRTAADCCGTTATQCQVITELARTGAIPIGELGRRLCLEKSWIGRAIDGLVEEDLVSKSPNPTDSRSWLVELTADGRRRHKALNSQLEDHATRVMNLLPAGDRKLVQQSLARLLVALRQDAGMSNVADAACCPPRTQSRGEKNVVPVE